MQKFFEILPLAQVVHVFVFLNVFAGRKRSGLAALLQEAQCLFWLAAQSGDTGPVVEYGWSIPRGEFFEETFRLVKQARVRSSGAASRA